MRESLSRQYDLGSREPNIQVWNVNLRGDRSLTLRHFQHRDRPLHDSAQEVVKHVARLWGFGVQLESTNAKGDVTVPNPTSTAIVRAGGLKDRVTYYRNDLAFAGNNAIPKNPHTFLTNIFAPATSPLAFQAQAQIASFFDSHGTLVTDPDGAGPLFEVPIQGDLPEGLNFIP